MDKKLTDLVDKALSRRVFLAGSGAAAATLIAGCGSSGTIAAVTTTPSPTPTPNPYGAIDYLNFALNLEYLEAEFYLRAATGVGLSNADAGAITSTSPVTVSAPTSTVTVPGTTLIPGLTTAQQEYIYEIAQNELDHVRFLRAALGTAAVARPNIDLLNSFNAAADAAGIGPTFNPFASYENFLIGAFVFEDVGVTAYHGAISLLAGLGGGAAYVPYATSIMAVEAYHAAEVRTLIIADSVATATTTGGIVTPNPAYVDAANKISALRATLDGSGGAGNETPLTALPPYPVAFDPTTYTPASSIVAADPVNSIAYARTLDEVLHIVYAAAPAAGTKGGGFFPSGLAGNISVTLS